MPIVHLRTNLYHGLSIRKACAYLANKNKTYLHTARTVFICSSVLFVYTGVIHTFLQEGLQYTTTLYIEMCKTWFRLLK